MVRIGDRTLRTPISPNHERLILNPKHGSLLQAGQAVHLDDINPAIDRAPAPVLFPIGKVELLRWIVTADSSSPDGYAFRFGSNRIVAQLPISNQGLRWDVSRRSLPNPAMQSCNEPDD